MIQPKAFINALAQGGIDFYAGVPDSLLKNLCAYITDNVAREKNIIAANEGNAVGLAAGYHLATGKTGCVYMQNSGEGNIVNPLLSLVDEDVYHIPMLLIIGWRGEPGVHDEPQHKKQGKVTLSLLETMGVPYAVLDENWEQQVAQALTQIRVTNGVYALIVRKGTFEDYVLQNQTVSSLPMSREEAIKIVVDKLREDDIVVSTTGMISRELFEYREAKQQGHAHDFLTVGSMGHASQIALGIALQKPNRRVFVFDGDGALLMHMGGMAIIGDYCPQNLVHVMFNNGAHDSVGGQPTVGLGINLPQIAEAVGYKTVMKAANESELRAAIKQLDACAKTALLEICVRKGNRKDLGRPTTTPQENKNALMEELKIAIGGGSVMDIAKLIRHYAAEEGYSVPLWAIPTTAGTGAEATHFAVVYKNGVKHSVEAEDILPDAAILYPPFTYHNGAYLTACTGFDALAQAIEAFWNPNATDESDAIARDAIKLIHKNLPLCLEYPFEPSYRDALLLGAYFAGRAINITKTTAPHAFSYAFTTHCGYPHGHAVAITFPFFADLNLKNNPKADELRWMLSIDKDADIKLYFLDYINRIGLRYEGTRGMELHELLSQVNLDRLKNNPVQMTNEIIKELENFIKSLG